MALINYYLRQLLWSPWAMPVCIFFSFFWALGSLPLFDLDEGAFTEATREMLASGVYSATYLDGEPRYDKPILFYWLQAASIKLFGFNEWAFRLPSVAMASLWAWALYCFAKEFLGTRRGQIAALFMVNSVWVALIARSAIADATLNLFLSLAMFDIWRYFSYKKPSHLWRVYLWMALGTLTKGPIAVFVPLVTSLSFLILNKQVAQYYKTYFNPIGWAIYLATVAPWLVAVYLEQGAGFFEGFILEHNLKRFSDTRENHGGTLFYYWLALPFILLPFSGFIVSLLRQIKNLWQKPLCRFLLLWFVVVFTVFSFSKTQLPHYILNGCVPLFLLFALSKGLTKRRYWLYALPLAVTALLFLLSPIIANVANGADNFDGAMLSRHTEVFSHQYTGAAILLIATISSVIFLPRLQNWQRLSLIGLSMNMFIFTAFASVASGFQQQPLHHIMAYLEERASGQQVVAYRMHMPSFSVYREKITPLRAPAPGELAITRVDRLKELHKTLQGAPTKIVFQSGGLVLVEVAKAESEQDTEGEDS